MICVPYQIAPSLIANAGMGLFIAEDIPAGKIITAPSHIQQTYPLTDILANTNEQISNSSIRWFEEHCTASPDWPDECYINHSHKPTGLWHLGFVFSLKNLGAGTEITFDYGHIIAPGYTLPWKDSESGQEITGYEWRDSLAISTQKLAEILGL